MRTRSRIDRYEPRYLVAKLRQVDVQKPWPRRSAAITGKSIDGIDLDLSGVEKSSKDATSQHQSIADSRFAPSQWETSLQSNVVSHWLGASLESALHHHWLWRARVIERSVAELCNFSPKSTQ